MIAYHYWVQYHLSKQLTEAAEYAASNGIILKGDLPIGVDPLRHEHSPPSCDLGHSGTHMWGAGMTASTCGPTHTSSVSTSRPAPLRTIFVRPCCPPHPSFFNKLATLTACPSSAAEGQNWGFPTYNWEEMAKDNYAWWRQRLAVMEKYFHA